MAVGSLLHTLHVCAFETIRVRVEQIMMTRRVNGSRPVLISRTRTVVLSSISHWHHWASHYWILLLGARLLLQLVRKYYAPHLFGRDFVSTKPCSDIIKITQQLLLHSPPCIPQETRGPAAQASSLLTEVVQCAHVSWNPIVNKVVQH